jgi:hypothetical protein
MPDDIAPPQPPSAPQTVAELLPYLPVSADYGRQWALLFGNDLADRLAEVQAAHPTQHWARPVQLTDGRHMLCGDLLSEVPNGLYGVGFQHLDASRFNEIAIVPWAEAVALLPQPDPLPE